MTVRAEAVDGVLTGVRKNFSFAPTGYPDGVEWLEIVADADPPGNDDTHEIVASPVIVRDAGGDHVRDQKSRVVLSPDKLKERVRQKRRVAIEDPVDAIAIIANEIASATRTAEFTALLARLNA